MEDLISALINLLWWPFETWKRTTESSRVGISPDKHATLRFWKRVALSGTILLGSLYLAIRLMFH